MFHLGAKYIMLGAQEEYAGGCVRSFGDDDISSISRSFLTLFHSKTATTAKCLLFGLNYTGTANELARLHPKEGTWN